MDNTNRRHIVRHDVDLRSELQIDGVHGQQSVGLRNISCGGLMADGAEHARRGQSIRIYLRRLGWVDGAVAWVQGARCGVAFNQQLDVEQLDGLVVTENDRSSDDRSPRLRKSASRLPN